MKKYKIVMYIGGFAPIGGIESFAHDFLLAIADAYQCRELVIWGRGKLGNPLLKRIADSGAKIWRSPWWWGCRWNLPDYLLFLIGVWVVKRADLVVFKRPPPRPILRALRKARGRDGTRPIFMLITPYRPAEYWGNSPDPSEFEPFDIIITQSEQGWKDLENFGYKGKIANIPYFCPTPLSLAPFPCSHVSGVIKLGFLGRFEAQKNLGYLLACYQALLQQGNGECKYELHFFGDGSERTKLQSKCIELDLHDVFFHGQIAHEEVAAAIDSCDIFLNASLTEGQCLVALEVLSRGRPFVATAVGALPEVIVNQKLGRLAPLGNPAGFAAEIIKVINSIRSGQIQPESVQKEFLKRYDRNAITAKYLNVIAATLENIRND